MANNSPKCSFCGAESAHFDGDNPPIIVCGNCIPSHHVKNAKAIDPVSPEMAEMMREMLTDPDETPEVDYCDS